jgi:hypothetical protein
VNTRSIATVAFVVAGEVGGEATRTDTPAAAPSVVTITATHYAFQAPDTIAAGFTTIRLVNNSGQTHMAQFLRLEPGRTMEEYVRANSYSFTSSRLRATVHSSLETIVGCFMIVSFCFRGSGG